MRRISDELNSEASKEFEEEKDYSDDTALIDIHTYKKVVKVRYGLGRYPESAFMRVKEYTQEYISQSTYAIRKTVGSSFGFHANKYLSSNGHKRIGGGLILNLCYIHIFKDTTRDVHRDFIMKVLLKDGSTHEIDFKHGKTYNFKDGTCEVVNGSDIKNLNGFYIY